MNEGEKTHKEITHVVVKGDGVSLLLFDLKLNLKFSLLISQPTALDCKR
jgi:hypothetical protein